MADRDIQVQGTSAACGAISYADDVIATIAGLAATEVNGISGMSGGLVSDLSERLGKKDFTKGVKVEIINDFATIDMYIVVEFGAKIQQVCKEVQDNVRKAIETMTSLRINSVNVHVQGINTTPEAETAKSR